jgi:superoxide reductase
MATKLEVYKCTLCGNIVMVMHGGDGELVCCGQPMKLMAENTSDGAKEKHVPVIEKIQGGYKVKVGSVAHPMEKSITLNGSNCWLTAKAMCSS